LHCAKKQELQIREFLFFLSRAGHLKKHIIQQIKNSYFIHMRRRRSRKQKKLRSTSQAQQANSGTDHFDDCVQMIQKIYRQFKKITNGAEGGVAGFNGSIRPTPLARVLRALSVKGNELVDFGAGSGRVIFSAVAEGASRSYGFELPENKGMKNVFDSMVLASANLAQDRVDWIGKDILDLNELNGSPSCAFSFWVGLPLPVQEHILWLCTETRSIRSIAVFKDRKWSHADQGFLNDLSSESLIMPVRDNFCSATSACSSASSGECHTSTRGSSLVSFRADTHAHARLWSTTPSLDFPSLAESSRN